MRRIRLRFDYIRSDATPASWITENVLKIHQRTRVQGLFYACWFDLLQLLRETPRFPYSARLSRCGKQDRWGGRINMTRSLIYLNQNGGILYPAYEVFRTNLQRKSVVLVHNQ